MTQQSNDVEGKRSWVAIKDAHALDGDADQLQQYYDDWARAYDKDVSNEEYAGPRFISEFYDKVREENNLGSRAEAKVLDAGCGTGLVGVILKDLGYKHIDGFDLSDQMVVVARDTGCYEDLQGSIDMNEKIGVYSDNQYDASLACGVFTLGHVPPESMNELIRVTRPGGLIVVSTRQSYYNSTNFQEVMDRLEAENQLKLLAKVKEGPYIAEEGARYWAFQVC